MHKCIVTWQPDFQQVLTALCCSESRIALCDAKAFDTKPLLLTAVESFLTSRAAPYFRPGQEETQEVRIGAMGRITPDIQAISSAIMRPLDAMVMLLLLKQAVDALTRYVQQSIAPRVQSGRELLEQFQRTRLLPTGCRRSST